MKGEETECERTGGRKKLKGCKFIIFLPNFLFPLTYSSVFHFSPQMSTAGMFLITSLSCLKPFNGSQSA